MISWHCWTRAQPGIARTQNAAIPSLGKALLWPTNDPRQCHRGSSPPARLVKGVRPRDRARPSRDGRALRHRYHSSRMGRAARLLCVRQPQRRHGRDRGRAAMVQEGPPHPKHQDGAIGDARRQRHQIFNEPSTQVTAWPPSQIVSSSNSIATRPSRPTQPWQLRKSALSERRPGGRAQRRTRYRCRTPDLQECHRLAQTSGPPGRRPTSHGRGRTR